jgi:hypothetical protein
LSKDFFEEKSTSFLHHHHTQANRNHAIGIENLFFDQKNGKIKPP